MASLVEKFIASVIATGSVQAYKNAPTVQPFLQYLDPSDQELFVMFDEFVSTQKVMPSIEFVNEEMGVKLPKPDGTLDYWSQRLEKIHTRRALAVLAQHIGENLNSGDEEKLLLDTRESLRAIDLAKSSMRVMDFRKSLGVLEEKWANKHKSITLGWETLDNMSGGARPGDVFSMVARPKLGKTYLLIHSALHVWATYQMPILFMSMEMVPELVAERAAAIATSTPVDYLKNNVWPTFDSKGVFAGKQSGNKVKKQFIDKMNLLEAGGVPFWIADGNMAATVDDISRLSDKLGPIMVYADGAYLIEDPRERNQYAKVSLVCKDLKMRVATEQRIPVFASWQFSREATKLKANEVPGLEHVAHSDAIGQVSSVVMGMFEGETIETKMRRKVNILAGRSGEVGGFYTNWDFYRMNMTEYKETEKDQEVVMA